MIRKICSHCKTEYNLEHKDEIIELEKLGIKKEDLPKKLFKGKGCSYCHEGYSGRIAIFEILLIREQIEKMIMERKSSRSIRNEAKKLGMRTLRGDGLKKVYEGVTTLSEVLSETQEIME